nr:penicillin-insensitive murein endopeptidase [Pseudenhygromyxa sp. WMMC2535]
MRLTDPRESPRLTRARLEGRRRPWARARAVVAGGALALLGLPLLTAASPPVDPRFSDLPDPGELEELAPPSEDTEVREGASTLASPPEQDQDEDHDTSIEDESAVEEQDQDEAEAEEASEPEAPKVEIKVLRKPKWIKHTVVPGERIDEIADRYQIRRASLIRWNKLDPKRPMIYAGRDLAIYTKHIPPPQQQILYTVQFGDTWSKIAKAHNVDADKLRERWNPKVPRKFKAGQEIVIWLDPLNDPSVLAASSSAGSAGKASAGTTPGIAGRPKLPLSTIKRGAVSVGRPNRGKIVNGAQLPENAKLYTIRKPDESFGSTHTLHNLQLAIANFRQDTGFSGKLVIGSISKRGGGRLRPHSSHQSGRDVDIRLPVKAGVKGTIATSASEVDWDASWGLIRALVATGEIQYIFLSHSLQKYLYKAAKRSGASKDMLERVIQYPNKSGTNHGIVRHARGHTSHIHIRFTCAANESRCESY